MIRFACAEARASRRMAIPLKICCRKITTSKRKSISSSFKHKGEGGRMKDESGKCEEIFFHPSSFCLFFHATLGNTFNDPRDSFGVIVVPPAVMILTANVPTWLGASKPVCAAIG